MTEDEMAGWHHCVLRSEIPVASLGLHVHVSAVVAQTLKPVVLAAATPTSGLIPAPIAAPLPPLVLPVPVAISVPAPLPLAAVASTSVPVTIPALLLWAVRAALRLGSGGLRSAESVSRSAAASVCGVASPRARLL